MKIMDYFNKKQMKVVQQLTLLVFFAVSFSLCDCAYSRNVSSVDECLFADLMNKSKMHIDLNHSKVAENYLKEAILLRRRSLNQKDLKLADALAWLGYLNYKLEYFPNAEKYYKEAYAIRTAALGGSNKLSLKTAKNLAIVEKSLGNFYPAQNLIQNVISTIENQPPIDVIELEESKLLLAEILRAEGSFDDAETIYVSFFSNKVKVDSSTKLKAALALAEILQQKNDTDKAITFLEIALKQLEKPLAQNSAKLAQYYAAEAKKYELQKKFGLAEKLLSKCVKLNSSYWGPNHSVTMKSSSELALLLEQNGKLNEAESIFKSLVVSSSKKFGRFHPNTASSNFNLAYLYLLKKDFLESENFFRSALHIYGAVMRNNYFRLYEIKFHLAHALLGTQNSVKVVEAKKLLHQILDEKRLLKGREYELKISARKLLISLDKNLDVEL